MEILQVDIQNPSTRQLTHLTCEISESKMVKCSNSQWFQELWSSFWHPCKLHCFLHFVLCLRPRSKSKCTLSPHFLTAYPRLKHTTYHCVGLHRVLFLWRNISRGFAWTHLQVPEMVYICTPLSQGQWSRPTHATNPNIWFDLTGFLRSDGRPEQCARKSQNSHLCHFRIIVEHNYHPHLHARPIKPAVHEQVSHVRQLYNVPKTHHLFTLKIMKKLIKHCCLAITRCVPSSYMNDKPVVSHVWFAAKNTNWSGLQTSSGPCDELLTNREEPAIYPRNRSLAWMTPRGSYRKYSSKSCKECTYIDARNLDKCIS